MNATHLLYVGRGEGAGGLVVVVAGGALGVGGGAVCLTLAYRKIDYQLIIQLIEYSSST